MQIKNAQCLNMQNAKNWDSRDTTYLVRWRPRLFQSSTVYKSLLVLNAKDDLRVDGQSFCFLAFGIQRETPFSVSVSSLSSGFLHLLPLCSADFICRKDGAKTESQSLLLPCFSSLFFHIFFSLLSLLLPAFLISQQRKDEGRNSLCSMHFFCTSLAVFSALFSLFSLLFMLFLSAFFTPFSRSLEELIYSLTYLYLGKI